MRVVVIGGTRSIGAQAVRRLAMQGHDVTVFHRGLHAAALPASVSHVIDPAAGIPVVRIPELLRRREPDVVLHMIGMSERDTLASVQAFAGVAQRLVLVSSGDVYRAYGVFRRLEEGPVEPTPIREDAQLRTCRFPYRVAGTPPDQLEFFYDKILAEAAARSDSRLPATVLRLPKVFGPEDDPELATVYGFRHQPTWRWTHGYVENVAAAIALAVTDQRATGNTYNIGELATPTTGERLRDLPVRKDTPLFEESANFTQDIHCDTTRVRDELDFNDVVDERLAMRALAETQPCGAQNSRHR